MGNADRIAIRIAADEFRLGDAEALTHITEIARRGDDDAMSQILGILAESGRDPFTELESDLPPGYNPDTGDLDYEGDDVGDDVDDEGEGMQMVEELISACLSGILKPSLR